MEIFIVHGPNLNLLGEREPEIYGTMTLTEIDAALVSKAETLEASTRSFQSNHEGALVDALQEARQWADGALINPGGLAHTSVVLRDAITAFERPVVEVHSSNIQARERFRHRSLTAGACMGTAGGFGWRSDLIGLEGLVAAIQDDV